MLETRRVKVDVQHVALESRLASGGWDDLVVIVAELVRIHAMRVRVQATRRASHALCCLEYHPTLLTLEG